MPAGQACRQSRLRAPLSRVGWLQAIRRSLPVPSGCHTMTIALSHLGEPLIAEMLSSLSERSLLGQVRCAATGVTLAEDLGGERATFLPDQALLRLEAEGLAIACDGAQTVDILCIGQDRAVAMEAKLGDTRLSKVAFRNRFCGLCGVSGHRQPRLTGSMTAVLDGLLPFAASRIAFTQDQAWELPEHWWLVVRERIWINWRQSSPVRFARILPFDRLAQLYGNQVDFDQLVQRVVGNEFSAHWDLSRQA